MARRLTVAELRAAFLDFFEAKGCTRYPSASLVPANDPTTLFTVAGMSQFKDMFLGRGSHAFDRAATCQKCIRTNDILNVGRTPRHHTFFEMLGNFSFNSYFKRETIQWAWEFLTVVLELDPSRLYVTVNHRDDDAWNIWADEVGFPTERMCRLGDDDNFWPASAPTDGPQGPGGNCSEIFWDFEPEGPAGRNPGNDDSNRFVEIWNLVFPEFNVTEPKVDGRFTLEELGRRNIDTGSGLERLACVIQGKRNNFDIDLLQIIVQQVVAVTDVPYVEGVEEGEQGERNALIRRIADHIRAVTFCIADGAVPGNTGRGYIVRRLIRRATLDIDKLGVSESRLHEIVPAVVEAMGDPYGEIVARRDLAIQVLQSEEAGFRTTLRRGLDLFAKALARHRADGATTFSGDDAFELFTTYGFPREVTEELAEAEGLPVDQQRFAERMAEFAEISKGGKQIEVFQASALRDAKPRLGATPFVGYDATEAEAELLLIEVEGAEVATAPAKSTVRFALSQTPFYGESGGQVGDTGTVTGEGFRITVTDTQKDEGLVIHHGVVSEGVATPGPVQAVVEASPRRATARHHSVTHLLHSALGRVLGDHVEQQGSKVEPSGLRFDFTHDSALSDGEIAAVEAWVNQAIAADHPVTTEELPIAEARQRGAKALLGEKYGDVVLVVSMGGPEVSVELCGGCHVSHTGDIQTFRILREEASSAGIRRIQAVAGAVAAELDARDDAIAGQLAELLGSPAADRRELAGIARALKVQPSELPERIRAQIEQATALAAQAGDHLIVSGNGLAERVRILADEQKRLRKVIDRQTAAQAAGKVDDILAAAQTVAGLPVYIARLDGVDGKALRQTAETIAQKVDEHLLVLAAETAGKALLVVSASPGAIAAGVKAGELVGQLAPQVGGGGGGKPDLAQAGGKNPGGIAAALDSVPGLVEQMVGSGVGG